MFFIFLILVLINYVSYSSNFVLNRLSQDGDGNITQNYPSAIFQDARNNSLPEIVDNIRNVRSPNFKVNLFDNRLSDDMLSIKQTAYGRDVTRTSAKFKTSTNNIGTPTLEMNQKWPAVELLYKLDEIVENPQSSDDFDFKNVFSEENEDKLTKTGNVMNVKNEDDLEDQENQSKDKVVDLRSLSGHGPPKISDLYQSPTVHNCSCSRSTANPYTVPVIGGFPYPTAAAFSHNWGSYTSNGMFSYSLLPFYLPYEPYFHYPVNIFKEYSKQTPDEVVYYNEEKKEKDENYSDNEDHEHIITSTKRRKTKKTDKCRGGHNTVIVNIDYDLKPRDTTSKWHTTATSLADNPNKLETHFLDDFKIPCPCSIYRSYCCSSSSICNVSKLRYIIFLLLIISDLFI